VELVFGQIRASNRYSCIETRDGGSTNTGNIEIAAGNFRKRPKQLSADSIDEQPMAERVNRVNLPRFGRNPPKTIHTRVIARVSVSPGVARVYRKGGYQGRTNVSATWA